MKDYRPLLISGPSPWLFPGRHGNRRPTAAFSSQMRRFVNGAVGIDFHPHLIRKIVAKFALDALPERLRSSDACLGIPVRT